MHLEKVIICPEKFPVKDQYPFNLDILQNTESVSFNKPVTFFTGENGAGKSTLLTAMVKKCGIHIWSGLARQRAVHNPYEQALSFALELKWKNGSVPGSFFASRIFRHFAKLLDEWEAASPGNFKYFGGKSLMTQSHGQSLMSYFSSRYKLRGIHFLDEPETALSPKSQIELLKLLYNLSRKGHAQFIIATHSPILLSCPDADIYNFDHAPISRIPYKKTDTYKVYKDFMGNMDYYLGNLKN